MLVAAFNFPSPLLEPSPFPFDSALADPLPLPSFFLLPAMTDSNSTAEKRGLLLKVLYAKCGVGE